jgi:hypothetical protein
VTERDKLLAEAAERDRQAEEIAQRIEQGEPCLESTLTYRRKQAEHLRFLAANTDE